MSRTQLEKIYLLFMIMIRPPSQTKPFVSKSVGLSASHRCPGGMAVQHLALSSDSFYVVHPQE